MRILPPGSVIGLLGGGQLARMTAMAAAALGYSCHIYCSSAEEPAVEVSARHTLGSFTDVEALTRFAQSVDIVTLEWENVPLIALKTIEKIKPVCPGASILRIAQDRGLEKSFAREAGVGTADFRLVNSAQELEAALKDFPLPAILKSTCMGYDGKGQTKIEAGASAEEAWKAIGGVPAILESFVDFECEVSVIVARREDGAMEAFPVVENVHRNHILAETHVPAYVATDVADEAEDLAKTLANRLGLIGLLAIEMFVLREPNEKGQRVVMNEIAPRPHNSGHWTIDACACSQFEQLIRAICGLPLGSGQPHSQCVMHNLLGNDGDRYAEILREPGACLHLYGKKEARPGRKMGHVTYLKGKWQQ